MLLSELAARTGATLAGDGSIDIVRVATLESGGAGTIAFLANPKYRSQLLTTGAAAVIVDGEAAAQTALPKLVSGNPYATFAKVAEIYGKKGAMDIVAVMITYADSGFYGIAVNEQPAPGKQPL